MKIEATFVRSAAAAGDFPRDGLAQVALVGRSNVGKSSLINALVRRAVARTSAAPGKTRLANVYRVARPSIGSGKAGAPMYLVDLPGYGYARGDTTEFEAVTRAFFGQVGQARQEGQVRKNAPAQPAVPGPPAPIAALLLVDARHPGMESDADAWRWLGGVTGRRGIVATKIDKLARGQRIRALGKLESVYQHPVTPVSAATGEGLDELWKLIDKLRSA